MVPAWQLFFLLSAICKLSLAGYYEDRSQMSWVHNPPEDLVGYDYGISPSGVSYWHTTEQIASVSEQRVRGVISIMYKMYAVTPDKKRKFIFQQATPEEAFTFQIGAKHVVDGFDEGIQYYRYGEIGHMIVPGEVGYGEAGLPRFGIDPNVDLEYFFQILPQDETHSQEVFRPRGRTTRDIQESNSRNDEDIYEEDDEEDEEVETKTPQQQQQDDLNRAINTFLNDGKPVKQKDKTNVVKFGITEAEGQRDVAKHIHVKTSVVKTEPTVQNRYGIKMTYGEKPKKEKPNYKRITAIAGQGGTQEV